MSKCPDCGTEMKPLATSVYCPNDCDRVVTEHVDPEKTPKIYAIVDPIFNPAGLMGRPPGPNTTVVDPDPDQLFGDGELDAMLDGLFDGTD